MFHGSCGFGWFAMFRRPVRAHFDPVYQMEELSMLVRDGLADHLACVAVRRRTLYDPSLMPAAMVISSTLLSG
jgi:hypothetical protein